MQHLEEVLAKNGTGIKAFIQSLEEVCLNFQKQQASIYILFLTFLEFKIDLANEKINTYKKNE
jgi:hypothetical protein